MRTSLLRSGSFVYALYVPLLVSLGCGDSGTGTPPATASGGRSGNGGASSAGVAQGGIVARGGGLGAGGSFVQTGGSQGNAGQSGAQAGSIGQSGATQGGNVSAQGGSVTAGAGSPSSGGSVAGGGVSAGGSVGAGGSVSAGGSVGVAGSSNGGSAGAGLGGSSGSAGALGTGGSTNCSSVSVPVSDTVFGWAAVSGDGVATTTGGLGGATVTATSAEQLKTYASSAEPMIIRIEGALSVGTMNIASNKTLIGVGPNATLSGSLRIRPASSSDPLVTNVILRNLKVDASSALPADGGDGIHIERAHHVWIDHCEVWDAPDGNTDITHGSNWITISWTKYRYTSAAPDPAHRFSNLIGHSESATATDRGRLKVTFHHNWWAEQIEQRMPRVRFGQIHVYNNYFTAAGNTATIAAGTEAQIVVENNHFEGVYDAHFFHEGSTTAQIVASGNAYVNTTGKRDVGQGSAFVPPYAYTMDPVADVPCIVRQGAGPH